MSEAPTQPRWREQFDRLTRYRERLEELALGRPFDRPAAWFWDDLFAFFVECHSFKDWLINDETFLPNAGKEIKKRLVKKCIKESDALKWCADIANGKKHLVLDACKETGKLGWTDSEPELRCWVEVDPGDGREEPLRLDPLQYTSDLVGKTLQDEGRPLTGDEFRTRRRRREFGNLEEADRLKEAWRREGIIADERQATIVIVAEVEWRTPHSGSTEDAAKMADNDNSIANLARDCEVAWVEFLKQHGVQ